MDSLNEGNRASMVLPGTEALVKALQEGQMLKNVGFSGVSMRPMLRQNLDFVDLTRPPKRLKKYDLPMYTGPSGKYIMHRVISVKDGYYICRGDNTYRPERVLPDQIVGFVCAFHRGKRHISVDAVGYRLYCRFWCAVYPLRKLVRRAKMWLRRRLK